MLLETRPVRLESVCNHCIHWDGSYCLGRIILTSPLQPDTARNQGNFFSQGTNVRRKSEHLEEPSALPSLVREKKL